ncbi:uncharacterized protein [Solanum tuberosum]|uniref:uncharacterized protein n=1 Tax=Solanum tuberosum TaxID=4113 RepID=UPI00073A1B19|nr:PREDICTED: uncharacterized protein LOC107063399 [Solanum tuberosum]
MKIFESPNPFGEPPIDRIFAFCSSALSPEGKEQIGNGKKQSAFRRATPRSSSTLPNDPGHKDVEASRGTIAPKQTPTYAAIGKSKFVAHSRRMIIEEDTKYVHLNIRTSPTSPRTTRNRAQLVIPGVVTTPQSEEGAPPIGSSVDSKSPFGLSSNDSTASSSQSNSTGDTLVPPSTKPPTVATEPNRWCVEG